MAVKKKNNLRSKVASRASGSSHKNTKNNALDLPEDPQAFLHEYKESKKDKLISKRQEFLTKLGNKDNNEGISKSSLRRRKRKQRDELLPKMQDLLTSLDSVADTEAEPQQQASQNEPVETKKKLDFSNINIVDSKTYLQEKKAAKNVPNARNKKGAKLIETQERSRFNEVLKDSSFKKSPFQSLRENITNRLKNNAI